MSKEKALALFIDACWHALETLIVFSPFLITIVVLIIVIFLGCYVFELVDYRNRDKEGE